MSRHAKFYGLIGVVLCLLALACSKDAPSGAGNGGLLGGGGTGALAGTSGGVNGGSGTGAQQQGGSGSGSGVVNNAGGSGGSMNGGAGTTGGGGVGGGVEQQPNPMAMDECGLHTKYPGDEYCILPPPPDKGFQLHIGPSNYDNPEPQYILKPGQEVTTDFPATSGNDQKVFFYYRQFRMRTGAHHNIITTSDGLGSSLGMGRRIGTSNNLAEDNPKGNVIAPENQHVGIPLAAHAGINVSLHSINAGDTDELREIWVNFWYRDPNDVTEPVQEMFQTGSVTFAVQPHQDTVLGPFSCKPTGAGRMLWFYGHRHANNVRFSAWRIRGAQKDLFYEGLNWEEPLLLEYSSTVTNTKPDDANGIEGGWSGVLDIQPGDTLQWECHVVNKTDGVLRFTNNTYTGEMCIMDAELVGTNCP
jgi:hypothetical protein